MAHFTKRHWLNNRRFVCTSEKNLENTCLSKLIFKKLLLQVTARYIKDTIIKNIIQDYYPIINTALIHLYSLNVKCYFHCCFKHFFFQVTSF